MVLCGCNPDRRQKKESVSGQGVPAIFINEVPFRKSMATKEEKAGMRRKKVLVDWINSMLAPLEKGVAATKDFARKAREAMPWLYDHLEGMLGHHIVKPLTDREKKEVSALLTSTIIRRLPHIDDARLQGLLSRNDASFLEILTAGLGIDPSRERNYSIIRSKKLFRRVLIANRGEISLRVIRACRELGIETVAIYSDQEKDALHVKFADKAYCIGKSKNYLDIRKIVKAAKKMGADAIHPGYGFLSERADFAALCKKKGIKFIGPSAKEIALLGDKVEAKKRMMTNGVPIIIGHADPLESKEQAAQIAQSTGYPVIIKAAAGGGGKGMRIVRRQPDIGAAFDAAKSEAKSAFGDDTVYIEKYVEDPRHIEFQIPADRYGNVIHFGERDCSIQRRHQKLIEEAPSPALTPELREKMGTAAVNAIKAIGYEGAGTVEFLLDKSRNFYFIEMNTRIQVEHGITELITGVDLVKEQIKLAAGARLSYKQEDIKIDGWAIECRLNAEDPSNDFAPSPGTVVNYLPPGGPGIKIGSTVHAGYRVSPHFDSLLALLMCLGKDREEALSRMRRALHEYVIEGVQTTIPFNEFVVNHPQFIKGNVTTSFIERYRVMEHLKKARARKGGPLSKEKKMLLVTTAVSHYLKDRQPAPQGSSWAKASRLDHLE